MTDRRLAAIMFTDIVGYTALMGESEQRGLAVRGQHRELLGALAETYSGEVVDENGDELVLVFPSAVDAVNCALAVQGRLRGDPDLTLRLGIHSGDVVFDAGRIYGDGVNLASRIRPLAEPGGICVSDQVYESIKNQANVETTSLGAKDLKNVDRLVEVFAVSGEAAAPRSVTGVESRRPSRLRSAALGAAAFVVLVGAVLFLAWPTALGFALDLSGLSGPPVNPPLPDGPSIVVLPFTNMSNDPQQEYFSDGITEDLTTALSGVSHLFVIARNSAFTYKGKAVNVADVGRELGVRYVLEGSVRKAGNRVRITAQLIDAPSGFHVWGEKYDRDLADIFALQSEITEQILAAVQVEIGEADMARLRRAPTESLGAYDTLMRGMSHFLRFSPNDNVAARGLFEDAIELDPGFAAAHAALAATYTFERSMGWSFDPSLMNRAEVHARRSIDLDPSDWPGHLSIATVSLFQGRTDQAIASAERAIEINPNNDLAHAALAAALLQNRRMLAAIQSINRAIRLNPRAPSLIWVIMAYANIMVERYDEGMALLEQVWSSNPHILMAGVGLAVQYEVRGRHEDAQAIAQQILRINPAMTAETAFLMSTAGAQVLSDESTAYNVRQLRLAGLP